MDEIIDKRMDELIKRLMIQSTKEFEVLSTNEKPPLVVSLWLFQRICRKTGLTMDVVSSFVSRELWKDKR